MTNNLIRRVYEHREGLIEGFTQTYKLKKLAYFESHQDINRATQREKNMKPWRRDWKLQLIEGFNPHWRDLWEIVCK